VNAQETTQQPSTIPAPLRAALAEPTRRPTPMVWRGAGGVLAAGLLVFPLVVTSPYPQHIMIMIFLNALMAQSWNILAGYCGQISLGHAAFFGIGAYASGWLFATFGITPWAGMVVGMVVAALMAAAIGYPTLRLQGHYFAIATLVIGESVQIIFLRWETFGAASGIWLPIVRDNPFWNLQFHTTKAPYYYIILGMLVVACLVVWVMERTRQGFYYRAIREDPDGAASLGIHVARYKVQAFMLSAALMAMAGTFNTQYLLVIDPEVDLALIRSILVVLVAVMGGAGTLWGPVIGAVVLVPLSELTRVYFGGTGGTVDLMIYGVLIVLICMFKPEGLIGVFHRFFPQATPTVDDDTGDTPEGGPA